MMKPYYQDDAVTIFCCDCRDVLPHIGPVDAVVTDPPYGLRFMGKAWDYDVPDADLWRLVLEACKPGAHLLSFAGTRTQHRMAVNIEDAGFEIRDMIAWVYGSGFPKSLDVGKAVPECDGWGTALKPALEPITVARKPLVGTVAENVLAHGTGALNVDGCRIESGGTHGSARSAGQGAGHGAHEGHGKYHGVGGVVMPPHPAGRWPSNLCHDGSDEATAPLGEASRFFYCAKASKRDRDEGLEDFGLQAAGGMKGRNDGSMGTVTMSRNVHPTVKPTDLMRYLCRLVTPPGGVILDPFMGSGSTGKAAILEGFRFIGVERDEEFCKIAVARIKAARRMVATAMAQEVLPLF